MPETVDLGIEKLKLELSSLRFLRWFVKDRHYELLLKSKLEELIYLYFYSIVW